MEDRHNLAVLKATGDPPDNALPFLERKIRGQGVEGRPAQGLQVVVNEELNEGEGLNIAGVEFDTGAGPPAIALQA